MNKTGHLILSLVMLSLSWSCSSKTSTKTKTVRNGLDSLLQTTISKGSTPGVAVTVVSSTDILYMKAYGARETGEDDPLQTTDAFDFSSIVKTVTSTAIMQLVEQGSFSLDDHAAEYLPILTGDLTTPTLRQMLSHSSGIQFSNQKPTKDGTLESNDLVLAYPPGTKLQYSNATFYTLSKLIAEQRNTSFPDYITENVFKPLGMLHSSVASYETMTNLTTPHTLDENELKIVSRPEVAPRKIGNGIFYSTIEDMSIWAQMHLNRGAFDGKRLLKADSYVQLWTPNLKTGWDDMKAAAGLGWFIGTVNGRKTVSHIGGTNGYSAALVIFPDDDRAIVIAGNSNKLPREILIEAISKLIFPLKN